MLIMKTDTGTVPKIMTVTMLLKISSPKYKQTYVVAVDIVTTSAKLTTTFFALVVVHRAFACKQLYNKF